MEYKKVLAIAGSDSGGGAGIQADLKTISACGCYAATAITAITIQNTLGVEGVEAIPTRIIAAQIHAVMTDIGAEAIKIGMLHSSETIMAVKNTLLQCNAKNIVIDPVMVSTSGHRLIEEDAVETLKNELLSDARIITPNIPEAEILISKQIDNQDQLPDMARELAKEYGVSVLLKAGHLHDEKLTDYLYNIENHTLLPLESRRIFTKNTHGTGCTLSSALSAFLARGFDLDTAALNAQKYIVAAIKAGADYSIGHGHGPVHHFHEYWM